MRLVLQNPVTTIICGDRVCRYYACSVNIPQKCLLLGASELRILRVPHDNDLQSMYESVSVGPHSDGTSSYVTAIFNDSDTSAHGLVLGSLHVEERD
jgi:hypothetical protein